MEVRMDSKDGTPVASPLEVIETFLMQTQRDIIPWAEQLQ